MKEEDKIAIVCIIGMLLLIALIIWLEIFHPGVYAYMKEIK
jgi:hypothetical protein